MSIQQRIPYIIWYVAQIYISFRGFIALIVYVYIVENL